MSNKRFAIKEVPCCTECPAFGLAGHCELTQQFVHNFGTRDGVPDWCPLPTEDPVLTERKKHMCKQCPALGACGTVPFGEGCLGLEESA